MDGVVVRVRDLRGGHGRRHVGPHESERAAYCTDSDDIISELSRALIYIALTLLTTDQAIASIAKAPENVGTPWSRSVATGQCSRNDGAHTRRADTATLASIRSSELEGEPMRVLKAWELQIAQYKKPSMKDVGLI